MYDCVVYFCYLCGVFLCVIIIMCIYYGYNFIY
nr:MAG TPA: hypothetical protein [Ackermannviridae sp.]